MDIYVDTPIKDNCWNFIDSHGEICVHCGCCSKDKKTRYEARLECCKRRLEERENFDDWAYEYPDLLEIQKENVAKSIDYYKQYIEYYKNKLKKLV